MTDRDTKSVDSPQGRSPDGHREKIKSFTEDKPCGDDFCVAVPSDAPAVTPVHGPNFHGPLSVAVGLLNADPAQSASLGLMLSLIVSGPSK